MARCLIRGVGDVGSAVAHALFGAGHAIVIHDGPAPTAHRRRMAFVDAVFEGSAILEGVTARRIDDAADAVREADTHVVIAVHVGSFDALASAAAWDVLVDARMRKRQRPPDLRSLAPLTIGLGPGFVVGDNCDAAVETGWEALGAVVREGATAPLRGEPRAILGHARDRLVYAPVAGLFLSDRNIGDLIACGEPVATIARQTLAAPVAGAIRGLTRSGVPVEIGTKVIEIDPRGPDSVIAGLGERPRRIAEGVTQLVLGA